MQVRRGDDQAWEEIIVPSSVRAIVMINLQTYMGGRDLWGLHDHHMPEEQVKNLKKPIFDDGLLEVCRWLARDALSSALACMC